MESFVAATVSVYEEHVLGADAVATQRARGVLVEPRVDALHVERVFALGQEAEDLLRLEPGQADRALEAVLLAAEGGEPEEWQLLDHLSVHPRVHPSQRDGCLGDGRGPAALHVEEEHEDDREHGTD